jgi:hypothetical protein
MFDTTDVSLLYNWIGGHKAELDRVESKQSSVVRFGLST